MSLRVTGVCSSGTKLEWQTVKDTSSGKGAAPHLDGSETSSCLSWWGGLSKADSSLHAAEQRCSCLCGQKEEKQVIFFTLQEYKPNQPSNKALEKELRLNQFTLKFNLKTTMH